MLVSQTDRHVSSTGRIRVLSAFMREGWIVFLDVVVVVVIAVDLETLQL